MFSLLLGQAGLSPDNFLAALLVGAAVVGALMSLVGVRCSAVMSEWARHNGWQIVGRQRMLFGGGPFPFLPGMPVYELQLENTAGRRRRAFVRCGDAITSVLSDHIAVEWADC